MDTFTMVARGLLERPKDPSICPAEDTHGPPIVPFIANLTFHQFATIVSAASGILSTIIIATLVILHSLNYSNPVQQRQIIHIISLIPWVSLFSFLVVWHEAAGEYLAPSLDFGCSIALSSFLLFMCDLVLAHREGFDKLFGDGAKARGSMNAKSPFWMKRVWYSVLQFIPVSIMLWIATGATLITDKYCKQSNSIHFAHIWLMVLDACTTTIAILQSVSFYNRNKELLQKHQILLKLFTFKSVLGLNFFQPFVISMLAGHGKLRPNKYMTFHDINTGLASLILACEMPTFAILMIVAFSPQPYKYQGGPAASPLNAIFDACNISDLLSAFFRGPMRLVREQQRQILRQNSMRIELVSSYDNEERMGDKGAKVQMISTAS
ncbi:Solute-trans-a domain containing protein [Pyrenophora teres f. maculata]|nr:Solute-trans-a domain containing protein [Pyrenophora teres f. maculata]